MSTTSTSVHKCSQAFTSVHKCPRVSPSVHKYPQCPQVSMSVHKCPQCPQVSTSVHSVYECPQDSVHGNPLCSFHSHVNVNQVTSPILQNFSWLFLLPPSLYPLVFSLSLSIPPLSPWFIIRFSVWFSSSLRENWNHKEVMCACGNRRVIIIVIMIKRWGNSPFGALGNILEL